MRVRVRVRACVRMCVHVLRMCVHVCVCVCACACVCVRACCERAFLCACVLCMCAPPARVREAGGQGRRRSSWVLILKSDRLARPLQHR